MKIFFDTEFIENGKTIDLISIGMVREDGGTYYAQNQDSDLSRASEWVKENVIPHLGIRWTSRAAISQEIRGFVGNKPEFWAYYADYDWVALCQLYGTMMNLPKGWPMFCMDIKQLCVSCGNPKLPEQKGREHHALADASWNMDAYNFLVGLKP